VNPLDIFRYAWTALRGHRLRTGLSILGVAIGVTSVILLTSLGEGARLYVTGELATLGSSLVIVLPGKVETSGMVPFVGGVPHDLTLQDAEALLRRIPRIRQLAPLILGQVAVSYGSLHRDIQVLGTTSEFLQLRRLQMNAGMFLPHREMDRGAPVCVIGAKVKRELFRDENPVGRLVRLDEWRFRVIGVLADKGESMGFDLNDIVILPVATGMAMFNQTTLFRIMVEANSYEEIDAIKREILKILKERHNNQEDVTLLTQDSVLGSLNRIFRALTLALGGIAAISLTVAGIGIMNVMLVSVSERTSEIGLMKAVGVTPRQIVLAFLAEAVLLSAIGGIAGFGAAQLLTGVARHLFPSFPIEVPPWATGAALGIAVAVGILFGVLPARRASHLDPILALSKR
jgi:putative ABC transport system permease protein